jgi:hypothetical protein
MERGWENNFSKTAILDIWVFQVNTQKKKKEGEVGGATTTFKLKFLFYFFFHSFFNFTHD